MEAAELSSSLRSGISHENPIVRENAEQSAYRRAVTRRASRIFPPGPVLCMQATERSGQTSFEQLRGTVGTTSRSALARTADSLASTFGAKPGRAITAASEKREDHQGGERFDHLRLLTLLSRPSALGYRIDNNHDEKPFFCHNLYL